jgi:hypothetical protein
VLGAINAMTDGSKSKDARNSNAAVSGKYAS